MAHASTQLNTCRGTLFIMARSDINPPFEVLHTLTAINSSPENLLHGFKQYERKFEAKNKR